MAFVSICHLGHRALVPGIGTVLVPIQDLLMGNVTNTVLQALDLCNVTGGHNALIISKQFC